MLDDIVGARVISPGVLYVRAHTSRVLPTMVGFGNYQPPLTPKITTTKANLPVLNNTHFMKYS